MLDKIIPVEDHWYELIGGAIVQFTKHPVLSFFTEDAEHKLYSWIIASQNSNLILREVAAHGALSRIGGKELCVWAEKTKHQWYAGCSLNGFVSSTSPIESGKKFCCYCSGAIIEKPFTESEAK